MTTTARGVPEGASVAAAKSTGSGDSAKSVKLVLTATAGAVAGPVRIVGNSASEPKLSHTARAAIAGLSESVAEVWLTVAKSSDNNK